MRKVVRSVAVVAVLAIVAAACSSSGTPETSTSASAGSGIQPGGTLNLAQTSDVNSAFDPQKEYYQVSWSYFKCCLLRTLLSTKPVPIDDGGGDIQPDLAAALPTVSDDGLTYTFTIKPGVMYSPPLQDVEVTAQDFIRALERESDPKASSGGYPFYYSVIEGFDDYGAGKADSISGLSAPDDHTLVVKLTEPAGDMTWRFTMPATAPIPPNPSDPKAVLGVAEGHTTNYGRFLVATGPYMWEGTEALDFSVPASDQEAVSGYVPGRSMILVRNPSYDPATDGLRPAYPDRIETTIGGDTADLYNKVDTGDVDYVVDVHPPANVLQEYSTNPDKQPYLHTYPTNGNYYISMNLGVPPFDDIHVRKALNWVIDKAGSIQLSGGALTGSVEGHIFPDGLINNELKDYDPYATADGHGDLEKAKAEMAQSKYDTRWRRRLRRPGVSERHHPGGAAGSRPQTDGALHAEPQGHRDRGQPEGSRRPRDLFQVHLVSRQVPACVCMSAGYRTTRTRTRSDHRCSTRPACTRHAATTRSSERARNSCPIGDTRRAPRSRLWTTSWRNVPRSRPVTRGTRAGPTWTSS